MNHQSAVLRSIENVGYCVFNVPSSNLSTTLAEFGKVVLETDVRIREGAGTYLASFEAVPFHNDHPQVRYIAWHCIEQDANDGASTLVDLRKIYTNLADEQKSTLARVKLRRPDKLNSLQPSKDYPFYQQATGQIFWAPWLFPQTESEIFSLLLSEIETKSNQKRIVLKKGETLLIDNHRIAHGRDAISPKSARYLRRYWLCTDT